MKRPIFKKLSISKLIPRTGKQIAAPGIMTYIGEKREAEVQIHMMDYNEAAFTEMDLESLSDDSSSLENRYVTWIDITGVHDEKIIKEVGEKYNIHHLVLEDIANTTQRPKVEDYDSYLFIIVKMCYTDPDSNGIMSEQVSLLVGKDYVISLQEKEGDIFNGLRDRIRNNKGKIRRQGSDYLMYAIIDSVADYYYSLLENIGEQIEDLEEQLIRSPEQELLTRIYSLRRELMFLRKSIWPMREVVSSLQREEYSLIKDFTAVYLRDVYDHTIQVLETLEAFRDMVSGMLDLYLSMVSNKMNEVMKVLTVFAAIFIPLTFVAGVYGMNFRFMPELEWKIAYPLWWGAVIILAVSMIIWFRIRKWI